MGIISAMIVGLIAGAIAKLLMPGKDPGGCIITMLLGVAGGIVGQFLSGLLGHRPTEPSSPGIILSVIGAIVLLIAYRMFLRRR
jgi:uncharacterized membrane protein YeaQ/YmgE (transglycosylase-associated protein family)